MAVIAQRSSSDASEARGLGLVPRADQMNRSSLSRQDLLDSIAQILADAEFSYVFGSVCTDAFGDSSDIDVAVQFSGPLSWEDRSKLIQRISEVSGRDVDLVDLRAADPIIKRQVLAHGRLLAARSQGVLHRFQMNALSEYADLKIDRRAIEERIARQ